MVADAVQPERLLPERTRWAPVVALGLAMFLVTSEATMAAVTLPGLGADLGVSPAATAWVVLAYALPMAALAIPAGRWGDGADTRAVFALAMIGIGLSSLITALAPAFWLVVVGRLLQGATGALVVAVYMPLITASVRPEQRGRAIGFVVTIMTIGSLAGVPLGGLVAGTFSWREVFLMKLPVVAVVLWAGLRGIPRIPGPRSSGWGLPRPGLALVREAALLGGAVAAVLLAFEQVDELPAVAGALAVAAVGLAVWWSRLAASRPLLALVTTPAYGVTLVALLATSFTAGLTFFLLPYYVSDVLRGSPELTGVALLFFVGAVALVSVAAGALADRIGTGRVALVGSAIGLTGMLMVLTLDAGSGLLDMAWRLAVLGIGAGLFNTAINTALLVNAPAGSEGMAGGVGMTARTIAMTVSPAVAALAWTVTGGGLAGFRTGTVVLTAVAAVGLVALLVPVRNR